MKPKINNPVIIQQIDEKLHKSFALHNQGQIEQAKALYEAILKIDPGNFDSIQLLGVIATQKKDWSKALEMYVQALVIMPRNATVFHNKGIVLQELKRFDEALLSYEKAIEFKSDYYEAFYNRGVVLQELKLFDEALLSYEKAIEFKGDYFVAYSNRGLVLQEHNLLEDALQSYEKAIEFKPDFSVAHSNRGNVLKELKRFEQALQSYRLAIKFKPNFSEAYYNQGVTLQELKLFDEAIKSYDKAIEFKSDYLDAYFNRGIVLQQLKRLDEALVNYKELIELKPDYEYLFGTQLHAKMHICDWREFETNVETLLKLIRNNNKASLSFALLSLTDSLPVQLKNSEILINDKHPNKNLCVSIPKYQRKNKIKVGYYSADFHNHATCILMAELFELHDKINFEIIAFSFGPDSNDEMRQRVTKAFDKFIDVRSKNDKDVALMSREMFIDIAVDLKGFTTDSRVGIFSYRAAPIQVSYLGYPGTMAAKYIDYIIADTTLIPVYNQKYYSEKIIYLPNSYQVNDRQRKIADTVFSKEELGLPKEGFIFCCFNNSYKITPIIFDGWMRILKAVEGSVLWLLEDNEFSALNLQREAKSRGVIEDRIIFAKRINLPEHLARLKVADLFIDTFPYNAHTTASDALWAGLPVLTCYGESFASRVAASLLSAIEVPELITTTHTDYVNTAIELATNPIKLKAIKDKLEKNKLTTALFDTPRFTKHIEAAYIQMYERYQADLPLNYIYIED
jgi:predicted O-linked N-acetylglucosamine transferase (SPINDLY family)